MSIENQQRADYLPPKSAKSHQMRGRRRTGTSGNQSHRASSLVRMTALVIASGIAVMLAQSAIIKVGSDNFRWALPVFTLVLMVFTVAVLFRHARTEELDLIRRHQLLGERMEALEDRTFELSESEQTHRTLCDAFGDAILHRDVEGNVTFANDAFCRIFDTQPGAIIGTSPRFLPEISLPGDDREQPPGWSGDNVRATHAQDCELPTGNGNRWFSWLDLPIRNEQSALVGYRSVARDITDRKLHEQAMAEAKARAEAHSSAKSRFLATVSHEIRTPMNGILGMAQLLAETDLTPAQANYNRAIKTSGTALLNLIEDILDVAKIEAGRFDLVAEPVNLLELAEEVTELLATRIDPERVDIAAYIAPGVPDIVETDRGRLRQVLINLIGNAVKFTANGAVCLEISTVRETGEGNPRLNFAIRDTGPGLSKEDCRRIFDEFEQTGEKDEQRKSGTGLGLTISQGIVRAMGSTIEVTSKPGSGSCFSFVLDLESGHSCVKSNAAKPLGSHAVALLARKNIATERLLQTLSDLGARARLFGHQGDAVDFLKRQNKSQQSLLYDQSMGADIAELKNTPCISTIIMGVAGTDLSDRKIAARWLLKPVRKASLIGVLTLGSGDISRESANPLQSGDRIQITDAETPGLDGTVAGPNPLRILLAEDNDINVLLVRSKLTRLGHEVCVAANGRIAVEMFEASLEQSHQKFAMILMDMHMPEMGGLKAIETIRTIEAREGTYRVPIIVLSADEQEAVHKSAFSAGANGFIAKPISLDRLMETIESCKPREPRAMVQG